MYKRQGLEAGQYFLGEIRCADKGAWDALRTLAGLPSQHEPFTIRVGRASRRGHGCLSLTWAEGGGFDSPSPWSALPLARRVPGQRPPGELVLTLLTDAILPDSWGRAQAGFDEAWMSELLQAPVTIVRAFSRSRQVDGFYGPLGLPRFRDVALTAGSTVGLRFDGPPPANLGVTLTKLEFEGIGLRREEGYGQVVFNHPLYDNLGALAANRVRIPNALQPSPGGKPLPLVTGDFKNDWAAKVAAYDLSVWAQVACGPIARILREGARGPVAELKSSLNDERFGQARNLLGYDLGWPRKVKRVVLKTRDSRQKITELLDELLADQRLSQHPEVAAELQALAIETTRGTYELLHPPQHQPHSSIRIGMTDG